MIKPNPIPICGKYVGQASMKKITPRIYSENTTKLITNIVKTQFIKLIFFFKTIIDFITTKMVMNVGIKNQ